jgi:hypothetical protein
VAVKKSSMKWKFNGNYYVLALLFAVGLLLPPLFAVAVLYFVQRVYPTEPKFFDRHFLLYLGTLLAMWLLSLFSVGIGFTQALRQAVYGTFFVMLVIYPFVYTWLWFDWNYRGK